MWRAVFGVALAFTLLMAGPAAGQPTESDRALAESLFEAGKELMKANKFAEACPKFAESNRIDPSAGTLLNLGKCFEAQGRTASAWAAYKQAIVIARAAGQTKRVEAGQQFVSEVEPKLSRLRVDVADAPRGLVVTRDGVAIGSAAIGVAVAIDPGEHVVEAKAPGYATWSTRVTVGQNADQKSVTVPALERAPSETPATTSTGSPPPPPTSSAASADDRGAGRRTAGWILGGVGVAALGVGAVFGVLTLGDASDAENDKALCPNKRCTDQGLTAIDDARTKALVSTLGIGVGLAAIAGGTILILTAGSGSATSDGVTSGSARSRLRAAPAASPDGGGFVVSGAF
jgi:hypothetical protein